jgi:2-polyprenyl-3-methyl-5-hydroxy-6-metoxy-1,4-benzoquinol methylase
MTTQCPLCNSTDHTMIYKHLPEYPGLSIVKCGQCSHIYTFSKKEYKQEELYNDEVYKVVENQGSVFDKILNWEYKRVIKQINKLKNTKGHLLDFGCGKGKFASIAQQNGWNVKAVETAKERAEYAKKNYGLDVSTNFYSTGKIFNTDFDVLTLFHVVEHLPEPKVLLTELIKNNLTKDGIMVIEVPNFNSWQKKLAGKKWMHLDPLRHISHFTPDRLDEIAAELSFKTVRTGSFSFHLGILGMTDSILKIFGYKKNIIEQLKNKKSILLKLAIIFILPFALIMESIAATAGKGGITRTYFLSV